ncbi:hypothetical protein A2685_01525 [Candidatus Woesebacteria bacterium RIFCSPHIGHO2_01_FULL_37_10]|uniref:Thioredoxin domain-containing protein n=1 Tax=Candidatus Woesebacteria bacterium RIFCSPHIGHO2_01_FULL_37_10 TaxID=1802489 RepID=A0A1F7XV87_9BACT|nr:MAG: hypothetical protein A2685_01525 [Candidatus Woesebacteria bacterium RIFCSPHIGHO2_01_FULL_37_10]
MSDMVKSSKDNLFEKLIPVLLLVSIVLAFVVGVLWQKVSSLEGGGGTKVAAGTAGSGDTATDTNAQAPVAPELGKVSEDQASKLPKVTSEDHVRGSKNAKVFLIEYSDFQCPFCSSYHPTAQKIVDEYKDVAWVYRHYPLDQIHPKARSAALGSECIAASKGNDAFWEFADEIFGNQETALADLSKIAVDLGVGKEAYEKCVEDKKYEDRVNKDFEGGSAAGVAGTPGSFLLNQKGDVWFIPGAYPYEQIKPLIDEALKS